MDQNAFHSSLERMRFGSSNNVEECTEQLIEVLVRLLNESTPKNNTMRIQRKSVHWWSLELKRLRQDSNHCRRMWQRKKKRMEQLESQEDRDAARHAKALFVNAIKKTKE